MKYMGSKRWMLGNGLSETIETRIKNYDRFVDLFCGSSVVSWHVSQNYDVPVVANDLQEFCRVLAASVIHRTSTLGQLWIDRWISRAANAAQSDQLYDAAQCLQMGRLRPLLKLTNSARSMCSCASTPITAAYGGHYFSPIQSIYIDYLRKYLPQDRARRSVALGALIEATSQCAAAPGHTAQPFSPTATAGPYLMTSWSLNILDHTQRFATTLAGIASKEMGSAVKGDANQLALHLREGDLVFIDPPYSSVHYSRFYHVLETVANGNEVNVSGIGRYPPPELRPRSRYSIPSKSSIAINELLETIRRRNAGVLITFPAGNASNGLSGRKVLDIAKQWFRVDYTIVRNQSSTLGGNKRNRSARIKSEELLISLTPN